MRNGRPSAPTPTAAPLSTGETALATVRATLVTPAVAVRSSGSTIAIA